MHVFIDKSIVSQLARLHTTVTVVNVTLIQRFLIPITIVGVTILSLSM